MAVHRAAIFLLYIHSNKLPEHSNLRVCLQKFLVVPYLALRLPQLP